MLSQDMLSSCKFGGDSKQIKLLHGKRVTKLLTRQSVVSRRLHHTGPASTAQSPLMPPRTSQKPGTSQGFLGFSSNSIQQARKQALLGLIPQAAASSTQLEGGSSASLTPVIIAVALASLGAFGFGYHLGVVNGPLGALSAELGFGGNAALEGLVVSSSLAGAAVGSLTGSGLADKFGRKGALVLDSLPLLLGAVVCATATSLNTIIAGRIIVGLGIGLASAAVPLYISEIAPTEVRGTLGSVNQLSICFGILGALLVNVLLPPTSWRRMMWFAAIPAVILGLGMLISPESPRWLASKGRTVEAEEDAKKLWGPSGPSQLGKAAGGEGGLPQAAAPSFGSVLGTKSVLLGAALFLFQQFSGINAIVYFSSSVFSQAGIKSAALASAAVGVINVLGTIVGGSLMDKAGRKQLLYLSFGGMAASMLAMAAGLSLDSLAGVSGPIALYGTLAYVLSFAIGVGPVPGLLVPEMNSLKIRSQAVSLAMVTHWICNFGIGQLFLPAVDAFGVAGVYTGFAAVCVLAILFVRSSIVETKGKSLEQIEREMA